MKERGQADFGPGDRLKEGEEALLVRTRRNPNVRVQAFRNGLADIRAQAQKRHAKEGAEGVNSRHLEKLPGGFRE